jgi:hypothetical protein
MLNDHEVDIEDEPNESKEDTSTKEDEDEEDEENDEANVLADLLDAKVVTAVMNANIGNPTRLGYRHSLQRFIVYLFNKRNKKENVEKFRILHEDLLESLPHLPQKGVHGSRLRCQTKAFEPMTVGCLCRVLQACTLKSLSQRIVCWPVRQVQVPPCFPVSRFVLIVIPLMSDGLVGIIC